MRPRADWPGRWRSRASASTRSRRAIFWPPTAPGRASSPRTRLRSRTCLCARWRCAGWASRKRSPTSSRSSPRPVRHSSPAASWSPTAASCAAEQEPSDGKPVLPLRPDRTHRARDRCRRPARASACRSAFRGRRARRRHRHRSCAGRSGCRRIEAERAVRRSGRARDRRHLAGFGARRERAARGPRHHHRYPRQQRRHRSEGDLDPRRHALLALRSLPGAAMADRDRRGPERRHAVRAGVRRPDGQARPRRDPQHRVRSRGDRAGPAALPAAAGDTRRGTAGEARDLLGDQTRADRIDQISGDLLGRPRRPRQRDLARRRLQQPGSGLRGTPHPPDPDGAHGRGRRIPCRRPVPVLRCVELHDRAEPGHGRREERVVTPLKLSGDLHLKFCLLLMFAVFAAFGPVALINQPLWDDWVLRAYSDAGTLQELYGQVGARELFWLVKPFASTAPSICTATELLFYVLLGPLTYTIIRKITSWSPTDSFWAALLTALAPLNQARFILSTLPYAFSSFFFALTVVLLLQDLKKPSTIRRLSISVCLLTAFTTNSFLVVAWLMPLIVAIHTWRSEASLPSYDRARQALRAILGRGELLLLPPLYWLAKKLLEPTYCLYADYNKFQMRPLSALKETVLALIRQFYDVKMILPSRSDVPELLIAVAVVVAMFVFAAWRWKLPLARSDEPARPASRAIDAVAVATSLALAICALFPYVAVGKPPRFHGLWETRHQTTLLLFSGFLMYAVLRLCLPRFLLSSTAAALTILFLVLNLSVTHRLLP